MYDPLALDRIRLDQDRLRRTAASAGNRWRPTRVDTRGRRSHTPRGVLRLALLGR